MDVIEQNIPFNVVLLAGGIGSRMESNIPKQYLPLHAKPIVLYSFELFLTLPEVKEIIVVCDPAYQQLFEVPFDSTKVSFALPGRRRQDSVFNGIAKLAAPDLVCIHDSARPLVSSFAIRNVVQIAQHCGAAALGVRVKATIKVCDAKQEVIHTPERATLWEMQTPQVARVELLKRGFVEVQSQNLTVSDDVSLIELIGHPVKVVEGDYTNIKVTTRDDLILAEQLLEKACTITN